MQSAMLQNRLLPGALAIAVVLGMALWAGRGSACSGYETFLPSQQQCTTCHQGSAVGPRNSFGEAWCKRCLEKSRTTKCEAVANCEGVDAMFNPLELHWDQCAERQPDGGGLRFGSEDPDGDTFSNDAEFTAGSPPGVADGVDECAGDPCVGRARNQCKDPNRLTNGDVQCPCPAGFQGDGLKSGTGCNDINECAQQPSPCQDENSQCNNVTGSFECPCVDNFVGSGRNAGGCTLENLCDGAPCSALSVCVPKQGGFDCRACPAGFVGDVLTCSACPPGYTGNGIGPQGCVDIDECATPNECSAEVSCLNRTGGRSCQACPEGFTGDGVGVDGCVKDVCAECSPFASCDPQRTPPCACPPGFTSPAGSDGRICDDVDECARGQAICGPNSTCQNVVGSFLCACNSGYVSQNGQCVPATCSTWGQDCGGSGQCDDSGGLPQCFCKPGLEGSYPNCVESKALELGSSGLGPVDPAGSPLSAARGSVLAQSGCSLTFGTPRFHPLVAAAFSLLVLARRRGRARPVAASGFVAALLVLVFLLSGCGDSKRDTLVEATQGGGAGGSSTAQDAGSGGGSTVTDDEQRDASSGGAPSGGAGGSVQAPMVGGPPSQRICQHSRECKAEEWCNPGTRACEARVLPGEALTFRGQVFPLLQTLGCPGCHSPGQRGDTDPSGYGTNLLFNELQRGYLSLVVGGVNCQGDIKRLCIEDPASSRLIRQVLDGQSSSPESIAFRSWSDPQLQTILRWIAAGAPRDGLCGNFTRDPGEACDDGPAPATRCPYNVKSCDLCNTKCQIVPSGPGPFCGDGVLDVAQEKCDPGSQVPEEVGPFGNAVCSSNCTFALP